MALIRKEHAGSDSYGHTWDRDGATVEIDDADQIAALMDIPDGGFSEVTPDDKQSGNAPEKKEPETPDEVSEVDPDAPAGEPGDTPAKKTAAPSRRGARKTDVEEG